jgi:hypothetical protein
MRAVRRATIVGSAVALLAVSAAGAVGPDRGFRSSGTGLRSSVAQLSVNPTSGPPKTRVAFVGAKFQPGETVKVAYKSGVSSRGSRLLCSAVVAGDGTFGCSGEIPPVDHGATGAHTIIAHGLTSHIKAATTFTLT